MGYLFFFLHSPKSKNRASGRNISFAKLTKTNFLDTTKYLPAACCTFFLMLTFIQISIAKSSEISQCQQINVFFHKVIPTVSKKILCECSCPVSNGVHFLKGRWYFHFDILFCLDSRKWSQHPTCIQYSCCYSYFVVYC